MVILVGIALVVLGSAGTGGVSTGGFILIGPFPIVFGTGPSGAVLGPLAVVMGAVLILLVYLFARRLRKLEMGPDG